MRIAILGTGYVSSAYARALVYTGHFPFIISRSWFDYDKLQDTLASYNPDLIINGAGYAGANIDDCEPVHGRTRAYQANQVIANFARRAAERIRCKIIHISTGCLFNGPGPFTEEDTPNNGTWWPTIKELKDCPFYLQTKIGAEREMLEYDQAYVFRIRMPFNHVWHPRNLLVKLISYPQILAGENSLTFLDEFCMRSLQLVQKEHAKPGIYHAAYPTQVNTLWIAELLYQAKLRTLPVMEYDPEKFLEAGHVRRSQAVLSAKKFEDVYGAPFGDPVAALRWCIDRMSETRPRSAP